LDRRARSDAELISVPSYREEVEAEFAALVRDFLDGVEEHYGMFPHIDVFGVVAAVNYTPADASRDDDQAFTHDAVSFRLSDQKPWVQVGVLRAALRLAESDD
jgi:hypothetical protein